MSDQMRLTNQPILRADWPLGSSPTTWPAWLIRRN